MLYSRYFNANLSDLSTYRTQLMGIATLMIIICHANAYHILLPSSLASLLRWGNWGMDIFLFLSGLGAYYSLSKYNLSNKDGFTFYYEKRSYRILVPYFIVYVPYCLIFMLLGKYSLSNSLLCLNTLEYWLFHRGVWFVSMILILYLVAPFLHKALSNKYKWLIALGIIIALMVLCNIPIINNSSSSILHNIQWAFNRVSNFILGITIGYSCKNCTQIAVSQVLLISLVSIMISVSIGVWKSTWLIVPIMLYFFVLLIKILEATWIDRSLKFLGKISFESYLTNITLKSILGVLIPAYFTSSAFCGNYLDYAIVIVAGLFLAKIIHDLSQKITASLSAFSNSAINLSLCLIFIIGLY